MNQPDYESTLQGFHKDKLRLSLGARLILGTVLSFIISISGYLPGDGLLSR
ncbi:hypothetical protein [Microcystis aeruginosa]|uniref:Uncharacterized protein n=1 Tax=Microcystis aeruginosa PCC 9443 TaxID=1160281 RepID=I4GB64_MICAE|nr:hypothetical protein [Microcystis aeruginosa]CCI05175.1 hypothetical protein MICAC_730001 [Microcystis aeruginosa PCC 9443]